MSMGVISVVEVTVPTRAEYEDAMRLAEARVNMGTEVRELAKPLGDDVANLGVEIAPFSGLADMPQEGIDIAEPVVAKVATGVKL